MLAAALVAVFAVVIGVVVLTNNDDEAPIVLGKVDTTAGPKKTDPGPPEVAIPRAYAPDPLLGAGGGPPGGPLPFRGAVKVPKDLQFFLVIGSDARPGQDVTRSRADSIHVAAVDPLTKKGTVLGFPRDSWVNVPGHGQQKINSALALGGPSLMVQTVRELTGFPIRYYAVTGFEGISKIVNTLRGIDVKVPYRMNDSYSGARFEPGWHHMNGPQVLAFTRARHGVPGGDLGRSENQGRVIVHTLEKLRAETRSVAGIKNWLEVMFRYARLDMSMSEATDLGVFARQISPDDLRNVVAQGTPGSAGGQSIIVLSDSAYELFKDVGADAEADGDRVRDKPPPTPTPKPKATPKPTPKVTPVPTASVGLPI
jgi:LCP family protein required for cell wall assembly